MLGAACAINLSIPTRNTTVRYDLSSLSGSYYYTFNAVAFIAVITSGTSSSDSVVYISVNSMASTINVKQSRFVDCVTDYALMYLSAYTRPPP
jgi:hypothetical protein